MNIVEVLHPKTSEGHDPSRPGYLAKGLAMHYAIAEGLSQASSLREAAHTFLPEIGMAFDWEVAILWRVNHETQLMVCEDIWAATTPGIEGFLTQIRRIGLPRSKGLTGHVWTTGKPIWIEDLFVSAPPERSQPPIDSLRGIAGFPTRMHCNACFPIKSKERILGALEFFSGAIRLPDPNIQETLAIVNTQIGLFMERHRVIEELHESEERYRVLADADLDVLVTFDENGSILFANQSTERVFGYTKEELCGRNMDVLLPKFKEHAPPFKSGHQSQTDIYIELVGVHKNGTEINLEVHFAEFLGKGKRCATGIMRDISESKRILTTLGETERKLQSVLAASPGSHIVAEAPAMLGLLERVKKAAASYAGILIQGETGSGKECIALTLHQQSPRASKAFVARNCAAIPGNLFESEMFGHKKGAFTGADKDRKGAFVEADGGTLFLDEIGDLEYSLQTKLLRAIQEKVIRPVGSDKDVPVDPRIICATNKDLRECCKTNLFREDLYYRLVTVVLIVPPLRERKEDIVPLARHFVGLASKWVHTLSPAAERRLLEYSWPGNVRELRSLMEQAVIFATGNAISPDELNFPVPVDGTAPDSQLLSVAEQRHILKVLKDYRGNKSEAAKALGLARSTLVLKLKGYNHQNE